ncbi:cystathionine beta-lyase [Stella sp.]|uniref:cystathionine beta-lyase n=1 Tax=Stella sp. TaxID=2912054 RepID=UPI0035B2E4C3
MDKEHQSLMRKDTLLTHLGSHPRDNHGAVNPPVYHASTITFPTVAARDAARAKKFEGVTYGRSGTPTMFALEEALAGVEGGYRAMLVSSGLAAITVALLAFVKAGDHVLVADTVYGPCRNLCEKVLKRFGVEVTYYDPLIGGGIAALIQPNTRVVYCESPGSLTFEIQDIPAIAAAAHARGVKVLHDNTWGTPYFFPSFERGVDVSIHAATKYIVGHSDAMLGAIVTNQECFLPVRQSMADLGYCAGPDDVYFGLRGLRTMAVRLKQHQENALSVATWLRDRPEVAEVLYPALPGAPGHELWKRDFLGACGLFSIVLHPAAKPGVDAMLDGMRLFAMGASWGGFESLILPSHPEDLRTATKWQGAGPVLRLHIGLEDPADLIADLADGFQRMAATNRAAAAE